MLQFLVIMQNLVADRVQATKDRGATAVEYGLMVALIAAVIVGAVYTLGGEVKDGFTDVNTELQKPAPTAP